METRAKDGDGIDIEINTTAIGERMMALKGKRGTRTKMMSENADGTRTTILIETTTAITEAVERIAEREGPLGSAIQGAIIFDLLYGNYVDQAWRIFEAPVVFSSNISRYQDLDGWTSF